MTWRTVQGMDIVVHMLSRRIRDENDPTLDVPHEHPEQHHHSAPASRAGVSPYYASSGGAICGDQDKESYSEDDRTLPVSPYGISKLTIGALHAFSLRVSTI